MNAKKKSVAFVWLLFHPRGIFLLNHMHGDATVGRGISSICELCVDNFVITSKDRQKRWKEFSFVRRYESEGCLCF
jgi:hypothetical protein